MDQETYLTPVVVVWEDAYSIDEWTEFDDTFKDESDSATVLTCGFLIEDSDKRVIISSNHDISTDNLSCIMVIPKSIVKSITVLESSKQ